MQKNELDHELLGIHAISPFCAYSSASRNYMFGMHLAQRLVTCEPDSKRVVTGLENKFSKYTFDIKMPVDGKILKVIDRYPVGIDLNSLPYNPEITVIYEDDKTKIIDSFTITKYRKLHQYFGFEYKIKDTIASIKAGAFIPKNTVFAAPASVGDNGEYKFGFNAKVAFMSLPAVSEDGFIVRRGFLDKLKYKVYESRSLEFGSNDFPLNIYGTTQDYKPFPDIGEYIRDDGILAALRDYDISLVPVDMSIYDTRDIDFIFDKCLFTRSNKGRVVDIKVYKNPGVNDKTPSIITKFLDKYVSALEKYHRALIDFEHKLRAESRSKYAADKLKLGRNLHRSLTEAYVNLDNVLDKNKNFKTKQPITLLNRKNNVDEYRIEFVIEYEITCNIGNKLTDMVGGKGVICKIEEDENMPVDELGRRADIILDPGATINRMNLSRLYEQYVNDVLEQCEMKLKQLLSFSTHTTLDDMYNIDINLINQALNYLIGLIEFFNPKQKDFILSLNDADKIEYLYSVLKEHIAIHLPPNTEIDLASTIYNGIEQSIYKPYIGKVTYTGDSGERKTTNNNIRIADLYMMLLDKTADDWSSVSISKLQHFGIISPQNKSEKFRYPYRNSPIRTTGESEGRVMVGYTNPRCAAEIVDRSNNPITMRAMVWNILNATEPTNIANIIDRTQIPYGNNKPIQMINHMFNIAGFKINYRRNSP